MSASTDAVIWHDVECGAYRADLPVWRRLAKRHPGPILDVGAGTGRVALDLAERGHRVTALDRDAELLAELARRAAGLGVGDRVDTAVADARELALPQRFALILVPMQTIQLLGGEPGRGEFLRRARGHVRPGGLVALAVAERFDLYSPSPDRPPLIPDVRRQARTIYSSRPTAVRQEGDAVLLERHRETIDPSGRRLWTGDDRVRIDRLSAAGLELEAGAHGLRARRRIEIPRTPDHVGSVVVTLGA